MPPHDLSPRTERDYEYERTLFQEWARERGLDPDRPSAEVLAAYLQAVADPGGTEEAGHKPASMSRLYRIRAAVSRLAGGSGEDGEGSLSGHPAVGRAVAAIAAEREAAREPVPDRSGRVVLSERAWLDLRNMVASRDTTPVGKRDRALLVIGAGAQLRPSEAIRLRVEDVSVTPGGVAVTLPEGGEAYLVAEQGLLDPLRAVSDWLAVLERAKGAAPAGPLFRSVDRHGNIGDRALSDRAITTIVRRAAMKLGPAYADKLSGRSLSTLAPPGGRHM